MNYTDEHIAYIRETLPGVDFSTAHKMFCEHFGVDITLQQYRSTCKNRKLTNGRVTRFQKGQQSYNKGVKMSEELYKKAAPTMFKPGHKPHNYKPIGTEKINSEGYVVVKVSDPNKWEFKHKLVWREHNGEIPRGSCLIFRDQDKTNCDISNLILISKAELIEINRNLLASKNPQLTDAALLVAKLSIATRKRGKKCT